MVGNKKLRKYRLLICNLCKEPYTTNGNRSKYCSQLCRGRANDGEKRFDYKWRLRRLLKEAVRRTRIKNLAFDIDKEFLYELWEENEGCCVLTGQTFDLDNWGDSGDTNPRTPSIDRIIPKLGYVKGNVRLITHHMNIALNEFGLEEFEKLARSFLTGEG